MPQLMLEAEDAMMRYELSKIPQHAPTSFNLRDVAIGAGAIGLGGIGGYYGLAVLADIMGLRG